MKIVVPSIFVQDQDKALEFYSEKLGFIKREDVPAGEFRWSIGKKIINFINCGK